MASTVIYIHVMSLHHICFVDDVEMKSFKFSAYVSRTPVENEYVIFSKFYGYGDSFTNTDLFFSSRLGITEPTDMRVVLPRTLTKMNIFQGELSYLLMISLWLKYLPIQGIGSK